MTSTGKPESLTELLHAMEKSENLRSLARECGLTTGDLRRRLRQWRRELEGGPAEKEPAAARPSGDEEWLDLPLAAELEESPLPAEGSRILDIWTDGASRGNPGPASVGVLFAQHQGPRLCIHAEAIGRATNNVAEYRAVLRALQLAAGWGVRKVRLHLDSELVARQLTGQYRVKSQDLMPFYRQIIGLSHDLDSFDVRHVRREKNTVADGLANAALDGLLSDPSAGSRK